MELWKHITAVPHLKDLSHYLAFRIFCCVVCLRNARRPEEIVCQSNRSDQLNRHHLDRDDVVLKYSYLRRAKICRTTRFEYVSYSKLGRRQWSENEGVSGLIVSLSFPSTPKSQWLRYLFYKLMIFSNFIWTSPSARTSNWCWSIVYSFRKVARVKWRQARLARWRRVNFFFEHFWSNSEKFLDLDPS